MDSKSVQAHSIKYLRYQKTIDRKKKRNLQRVWNKMNSIEKLFCTNEKTALFQIHSQGMSILKLLRKFHKYNEMDKIEILSLHAVLEKYFVAIEMRNAEFIVKRLVLTAKLDELIRGIAYGNRANVQMPSISFTVLPFCEHFDIEKNVILLLAIHCIIKSRLIDIEANNDEIVGSHFEVNARLRELESYETDDLDVSHEKQVMESPYADDNEFLE